MVRRIGFALYLVAMPLLLMELGLRIVGSAVQDYNFESRKQAKLLQMHDPGGYLMNPPDSEVTIEGHRMQFNSFGMRDVEPERPKPKGVCRLLIIGDSVTYGSGVRQEAIFGYRMRERLAAIHAGPGPSGVANDGGACSPGQRIDVVITAIPGWNTLEQERFLRVNLRAIEPDLALLVYVDNDRFADNPLVRANKKAETVGERLYRGLIIRSRLFEHVAFVYKSRVAGADDESLQQWLRFLNSQKSGHEPFSKSDPGWRRSRQALQKIRSLLASSGAKLVIVSYRIPTVGAPEATEALKRLSAKSGVPVYDTLEYFEGRPLEDLVNRPGVDLHPNAEAHDVLAERFAAVLVEQGHLFGPIERTIDGDVESPSTPLRSRPRRSR
jgi:hypothetical protein